MSRRMLSGKGFFHGVVAVPFNLDTNANAKVGQSSIGSLPQTLPAMSTDFGNVIIVVAIGGIPTISGITDTAGNTYTKRIGTASSGNTEMWTATSVSALSGNVITLAGSTGAGFSAAAAAFSGGKISSPFDSNGALPVSAGTITYTTTNSDDILLGCQQNQGSGSTVSAGWTLLFSDAHLGFDYKIVSAPQSGTASGFTSTKFGNECAMAIVKGP